jgi:starvation-inducible outer membrane lipoprotein
MTGRILGLILLAMTLVVAGCEAPAPKLSKEEFEKKQQKKEKREGHPFE